jgi:uncharacterized protein (TIGR03000 family)
VPASSSQPAAAATEVAFSVRTQSSATLWINGAKSTQSGTVREIVSSGLAPGRSYSYDFRAEWTNADGKVVELTRRVSVHGGERYIVDFTAPPPAPQQVDSTTPVVIEP